jgi:hypothetical protein
MRAQARWSKPRWFSGFFDQAGAYVTSGYGSRIELVDPRRGTLLRSARQPYGSFNLAVAGGLVVTSSLLNGKLAELDTRLNRLRTVRIGGAARDVAVTVLP